VDATNSGFFLAATFVDHLAKGASNVWKLMLINPSPTQDKASVVAAI
jgi:hypothetical protein